MAAFFMLIIGEWVKERKSEMANANLCNLGSFYLIRNP